MAIKVIEYKSIWFS